MVKDLRCQSLAVKADIFKVEDGTGGDDVRGGGAAGSCTIVCCAVAKVRTKGFPFAIVAAVAGVI